MTSNELKEKYAMLYDYMATSKKTEYMKAFGNVMSEMMDDLIMSNPSKAEDYIEKLCAILAVLVEQASKLTDGFWDNE